MKEITIAGKTIKLDDEGYLADVNQWDHDVARELAKEEGLELTDKHLEVLEYLRKQFLSGEPLTIRKVGNSGLVDIKQFYALFPKGPLKMGSKYAGIPKPTSCV